MTIAYNIEFRFVYDFDSLDEFYSFVGWRMWELFGDTLERILYIWKLANSSMNGSSNHIYKTENYSSLWPLRDEQAFPEYYNTRLYNVC